MLKRQFDDILPINSAFSGRRRMGIPPFDSSRRVGSNGGMFVLLRPLELNGIYLGWDLGLGWDYGKWDGSWDSPIPINMGGKYMLYYFFALKIKKKVFF